MGKKHLSDILPQIDSTHNIGATDNRWANIYADTLYGDGSNLINIAADVAKTLQVTVKNVSGGQLTKGTVVHVSPSASPPSGNVVEVIAADYDDAAKMPAVGILKQTIADEAEGEAVMSGALSGIATDGFTAGDELYVGADGALTNTKPQTAGQLIQKIAVCVKSHATNGLIKIFGAGRSNDVPLPLYIDNTNQRVGIGEPSPSDKLDVDGKILADAFRTHADTVDYSIISRSNAGNPPLYVQSANSGTDQPIAKFFYGNTSPGQGSLILNVGKDKSYFTNTNVGIGTTSPGAKLHVDTGVDDGTNTVLISHTRNNSDVATEALKIDMDLSGADTTSGDRINSGIFIDIDSSADGDASNEHRVYGIYSDVRHTGFSDIVRAGYFRAENNNSTEKVAQLVGAYGQAEHDSNSANGGVASMMGVFGTSNIQDTGDVDNAYGGYFNTTIGTNRVANVDNTYGVRAEIQIDKDTPITFGNMIGVASVIDNNEDSTPVGSNTYLFKGDYQGTRFATNAWGIYVEGDKHYLEGDVGIGTDSPDVRLEVVDDSPTDGIIADFVNSTNAGGTTAAIKLSNADSESCDVVLGANRVGANFGSDFFISLSDSVDGSNQERFRITEDGNVGIGTDSPNAKLEVVNDVTFSNIDTFGQFMIKHTAGATGDMLNFGVDSVSSLAFIQAVERGINSIPLVLQRYGGNVGINETDPNTKLHVTTTAIGSATFEASTQGHLINLVTTNNSPTYNGIRFYHEDTQKMSVTHIADGTTRGYVQIGNNWATGSEILVVDGRTSRVGIGTNDPLEALHVNGNILGTEASSLIKDIVTDASYESKAFYNPETFNAFAGADQWATIALTNVFESDRTTAFTSIGAAPFRVGGNRAQLYFNSAVDEMVIEIDHTAQPLKYHAIVGMQWSATQWVCRRVKIEAYNGSAWTTGLDITDNGETTVMAKFSLDAAGIQKTKFTLGDPQNQTNFYTRISKIFGYDYQGVGSYDAIKSGTYYLEKFTDSAHYGNIYPAADSTYNLGTTSEKYSNVYADTLHGDGSNITSISYSNITGTPTIPTDFVSKANGGTFSGPVTISTNTTPGLVIKNTATSGTDQLLVVRGSRNAPSAGMKPAAIQLQSFDSNADPQVNITGAEFYMEATDETTTDLTDFEVGIRYRKDGALIDGFKIHDGEADINGNLTVSGDLTVGGTTTTLNTETIEVEDNILQLNTTQGTPDTATAATSGISIYRGDGVTQASFIFDDGDDTWDLTNNLVVAGNISAANLGTAASSAATDFVAVTGDTMTGALTINPTSGNAVLNVNGIANSFIEKDSGNHLYFANNVSDKDIIFRVNDNGSNVIALRIDGSENGNSTFSGNISASNLSGTNTGDQDLSGYALTSHNHDSDYVNVTGDTMTGQLEIALASNQLKLSTGTAGDGYLNIGHFSNGTFIGTYGDDGGVADIIRFGTHSGDERMRITSDGNVGIGTTSPDNLLEIETEDGASGSQGIFVKDVFAGTSRTVSSPDPFISIGTADFSGATSTIYLGEDATATGQETKIEYDRDSDTLGIFAKGQGTYREHVRFGNPSSTSPRTYFSGDVGIGATSPGAALHVAGKQIISTGTTNEQSTDYLYVGGDGLAGADAAIYLGNAGDGSGYGWRFFYQGTGSGNLNKLHFRSENLGTQVDAISLKQDGDIQFGAYGSGTFTGTTAYNLAVDSSGNIIENSANTRSVFVATSTDTTTNINATTTIQWNSEDIKDSGYTHSDATNPEQITITQAGTYKIYAAITYTTTVQRANVALEILVNDVATGARGAGGYVRSNSGHNDGTTIVEDYVTVNANDVIQIQTSQEAVSGTVTLRSGESKIIIEKLTGLTLSTTDANTLGGLGATDFVAAAGDTMTGALTINEGGATIKKTGASQSTVLTIEQLADVGSSQDLVIKTAFDRDVGIKFQTAGGINHIYQDSNGDDALIFSTGGYARTTDAALILHQNQEVIIPNGNVGIGETTPGAKLDVNGVVKVNGGTYAAEVDTVTDAGIVIAENDFIYTKDGGNLRKLIGKTGDVITIGQAGTALIDGVSFLSGSNPLYRWYDDGSVIMTLDSTGLGIGVTSPSEKLHIGGKTYIESQGVNWNETTPGTARGALHFDPVGDGADNTGNAITFGASDTDAGANAQAGIYTRSDGTYGTKMYFATTNLYSAGSKTRMMIDYNGNVGIGTTSPAHLLDVNEDDNVLAFRVTGGGGGSHMASFVRDVGATGSSVNINAQSNFPQIQFVNTGNTFSVGGDTSGNFKISDNTAIGTNDRITIDNTGNVGIRTTDPLAEFHVQQANSGRTWTVHGNTVAIFENNASAYLQIITGNSNEGEIWFSDAAAQVRGRVRYEHSNDKMEFWTAGAERAFIDSSANLHVDGDVVAYSTSISDIRLKDNINTIDSALDKVKKLRGVEYTWNAGSRKNKKDLGVIAQEVEEVLPDIVHEHKMDFIDEQVYKTVDYEKITAVLIEAIKEQQKQIDELKSIINGSSK